ncbi:MAG: Coenzyme F420 hydrogenase/dehydrogenase, beta subunit C-terminal domain [Candidatus Hodarchaeota archaeon]
MNVENQDYNAMGIEKAKKLPLLLHASKSFRLRCILDAKDEIISSKRLTEGEYERVFNTLLQEEINKAMILREIEEIEENLTVEDLLVKLKDLDLPSEEIIALTYQLALEGYLSTSFDEKNALSFKFITSNPSELHSIYVPVNLIEDGKACSGCSMCQAVCPIQCIEVMKSRVTIDMEKCIRCGLCYTTCPRSFLPKKALEWAAKQEFFNTDELKVGHFMEAWSARTTQDDVRAVCQDGGIATTIAIHALETGMVNAGIGSRTVEGDPWNPEPVIMKNREDALSAAGTKYVNTPSLRLLGEFQAETKVAVVGTPCMMQALKKSDLYRAGTLDLDNIAFRIGIFCMESFTFAGIKHLSEEILETPLSKVKKMDINMGKFFVYLEEGEPKSVEMKEITKLARMGCHCCYDLTSEEADISVGSIGSPSGWNTVLIRNQRGKELFDSAVEAGLIEKKSIEDVKPGLGLLKKLSFRKKRSYEKEEKKRNDEGKYHPIYEMKLPPKKKKEPSPNSKPPA